MQLIATISLAWATTMFNIKIMAYVWRWNKIEAESWTCSGCLADHQNQTLWRPDLKKFLCHLDGGHRMVSVHWSIISVSWRAHLGIWFWPDESCAVSKRPRFLDKLFLRLCGEPNSNFEVCWTWDNLTEDLVMKITFEDLYILPVLVWVEHQSFLCKHTHHHSKYKDE